MARLFDDAQNEYLHGMTTPGWPPPCTFACWVYRDAGGIYQTQIWVGYTGSANDYLVLDIENDNKITAIARYSGGFAKAPAASATSINTWHHACAVFASHSHRKAFMDGTPGTPNTTTITPASPSATDIGRHGDSTPGAYMSGRIAEAAIWNVALTDAEVAILAKGYCPLFVRPHELYAYWPLIRDWDKDIVGVNHLTPYNTPGIASHPRIIYPTPPFVQGKPGISIPVLMQHYKKMRVA